MGWSKGRQKFKRFYEEELFKLKQELEEGTEWERMKKQIQIDLEKELAKKLPEK